MDKFRYLIVLIISLYVVCHKGFSQKKYQPLSYINELLDSDTITCEIINIGEIQITSGKVVACDPLGKPDCLPFYFNFPKGTYPVEIVIAELKDDQRIVMSSIIFSNDSVNRWGALGYTEAMEDYELLGYFVESGIGSFMDLDVCNIIDNNYQFKEGFYDYLVQEMRKNYKNTREWCVVPVGKQNIAIFSAGYGDGIYPSFVGYNKNGDICRLTTSFLK